MAQSENKDDANANHDRTSRLAQSRQRVAEIGDLLQRLAAAEQAKDAKEIAKLKQELGGFLQQALERNAQTGSPAEMRADRELAIQEMKALYGDLPLEQLVLADIKAGQERRSRLRAKLNRLDDE